MQRVYRSTRTASRPTNPAQAVTPGYFTAGDPGLGIPATVPGFEWFNGIQETVAYVIEQNGLTLDKDDDTLLYDAIAAQITAQLASVDAFVYKGVINCSANPNYPAANAGDTYKVSVAGKIGGGSGPNVEVGDTLICAVDSSASDIHASVGANWGIIQGNIDGAVTGPASAVSLNLVRFSGTTGKVVADSGAALSTDGTMASNSTAKVPVEAAIVTYVAAQLATVAAQIRARQTALLGAVNSSGVPVFLTAGSGLTLNILGTTTPLYVTAASGNSDRLGIQASDTTLALTNTATNYVYADIASNGTITWGAVTVTPAYQLGGTYSTTNNQHTFNINEMTMKVGNGSAASQVWRVFVGEAVTSGGTISSVINYALNGRAHVEQTGTATNNTYTLSHNVGQTFVRVESYWECTSADGAYAVGERVELSNDFAANYRGANAGLVDRNTLKLRTGVSWVGFGGVGNGQSLDSTKWKYCADVTRVYGVS